MYRPAYTKVKEVFSAALDLDPERREAFLDLNCRDSATRREVASLLQAHCDAGAFLEGLSAASVIQNSYQKISTENFIGNLIDKYRVVKEIGRGGMGIVFLAERENFKQQVAIKIIKRGMDSDAILARFVREREILAGLNHPNVAKLLDGGTTEDGLPFFVMEYVDGVPINEFCKNLKERDILDIFRKACSAISFAHQKLIVHRDLKPSNILINRSGEPKLLDFGIAKLLDETDADATQPHQRVLTPRYASPEQTAGSIVGTATDVYSLGKILAELVEQSTELAAHEPAKNRGKRKIRPDLQNILTMAVVDDVELRYGSVERFSDDIRRYVEDLPVSARRVSFSYRTQKFVQRNRALVALTALLVLSLIGGLTATIMNANAARRQRQLAEKRFENLRRLSDSFVTEIHGAIQNLPGSLPARQLLLRRAVGQLDALAEESENDISLQDELATAYFNLASLPDMPVDEKDRVLRRIIAIYENLLRNVPNNTHYSEQLAVTYIELGDTEKVRGSVAEGLALTKTAVSIFDQIASDEPRNSTHLRHLHDSYGQLGAFEALSGDNSGSLAASRRSLEIGQEIRNLPDPPADLGMLLARSHLQIGTALTATGDYKTGVTELQTAMDGFAAAQAADSNDTSISYYLWLANRRLATATELGGNRKEGFEYAGAALSIMEKLLATSPRDIGYHRNSAISGILLGQMLVRQSQAAKAVPYFRRALDLSEQVLASDPQYFESKMDVALSKSNLGNALIVTGQKDAGLIYLREALTIFDEISRIDTASAVLKNNYAEARNYLSQAQGSGAPIAAK